MDMEIVEKAVLLLQKYELSELSFKTEQVSICLKKEKPNIYSMSPNPQLATTIAPVAVASGSPGITPAVATNACQTIPVKSSLVGTFYRATDPSSPPLCSAGQIVKKGDPLGLIEAMKVLTMITAPCAGKIVDIKVENATIVEFDEVLMHIAPQE